MRVNVYSEEVRDRVTLKSKTVNGVTFYGIDFLVGDAVEHTPGDDDSSGVTFWFNSEYVRSLLLNSFGKAIDHLNDKAATQC